MIELATTDLSARASEELCAVFAVEFIRVIDAIIWALDDESRPPLQIFREALELACRPAEVHARVARCSPSLAENIVAGLCVVGEKIANELLRRMTPSAVVWWKTHAPPPVWRPEAAQSPGKRMSELFRVLRIDRLIDFTSNDPADLQSDAVVYIEQEYNEQMRELASLLPPNFEVLPLENSLGVAAELRGERWEFLRTARRGLVQRIILRLFPLVSGFDPAQRARDGYSRTFVQREAKKHGGTGGRHARAAGTVDPKAVNVSFDECLNIPAASDLNSLGVDAERIMRIAKKRLGAKAVVLFKALAEGKAQKDAAKAAGITDRTARNYLTKMRRLLTQ